MHSEWEIQNHKYVPERSGLYSAIITHSKAALILTRNTSYMYGDNKTTLFTGYQILTCILISF